MKLDGSLADNLKAAIRSARRLRGRPVYPDTLTFWRELLEQAHRHLREDETGLEVLITELEQEMAAR